MRILIIPIILLLVSCEHKSNNYIIKNIDVSKWNNKTIDFINNNCNSTMLEYNKTKFDGLFWVTKYNDTIESFNDHLNLYIKNRFRLIKKLKEDKLSILKSTDTLIISETYYGTYNPRISYEIKNKEIPFAHLFYYNLYEFEESKKIKQTENNYDLIEHSKCINQTQGNLNTISIVTCFYFNNNKIEYEIKNIFFGTTIID